MLTDALTLGYSNQGQTFCTVSVGCADLIFNTLHFRLFPRDSSTSPSDGWASLSR